jgi:acyl-[acyl carrier protein]--UDP-N-acetylglucosamine O-acyltransferase
VVVRAVESLELIITELGNVVGVAARVNGINRVALKQRRLQDAPVEAVSARIDALGVKNERTKNEKSKKDNKEIKASAKVKRGQTIIMYACASVVRVSVFIFVPSSRCTPRPCR